MKRPSWIAAALATPLLLVGQAKADFTYTTATVPTSQGFGPASPQTSMAQFGATSSLSNLAGTQGISLVAIADQTTASPSATDSGAVPFTDTVTITQTAGNGSTGGGTGTLTLAGTITFSRSDTGGQSSTFALNAAGSTLTTTIGNTTYSLANFVYAQPTVNVPLNSFSSGSLSGVITVTTVPEPASMALVALGGVALAGPALRRRLRRRDVVA